MILRERQRKFVSKSVKKLTERLNTLSVAPTGAGKTVCMAAVACEVSKKTKNNMPSLVLQHRDELVAQNSKTFRRYTDGKVNPRIINANKKVFDNSPDGFNFAMVQTLCRPRTLNKMPALSALYIDEAHHAVADTYLKVIHRAKELNPNVMIYGTTATPSRGDNKAMSCVFDNCADQITLHELIRDGHLVKPVCKAVDLGNSDALKNVPKNKKGEYNQTAVSQIMNSGVANDEVFKTWMEEAGDRQTIGFTSDIKHAQDITEVFRQAGVKASYIHGDMGKTERREILKQYDDMDIQVLFNVGILTEGFDNQPTSCVLLLRIESFKSTMIQMIGRGLRKVDPELYPGVIKDDCIVIDYGISLMTHGSLLDEPELEGDGTKECPSCESVLPEQVKSCAICGYKFPVVIRDEEESVSGGRAGKERDFSGFVLKEIDILDDSPFKYEELGKGFAKFCIGFTAWACVVAYKNGRFYTVGGKKKENGKSEVHILANSSDNIVALQTADDWMREHGDKKTCQKSKRWLGQPPTTKQVELMEKLYKRELSTSDVFSMTKYRSACLIEWMFNLKKIKSLVQKSAGES